MQAQNIIQTLAPISKSLYGAKVSAEERVKRTIDALAQAGIYAYYEGEKPCGGASFTAKTMTGGIRINVRCGHGRHNYAPCVFIPFNA